MRLMTIGLTLLLTAAAFADGEHEHTHPEFDTPIGFTRWMHSDDLDLAIRQGPVLDVRQDGSVKMYAQHGDWTKGEPLTWFHRKLIWRWKVASEGPFKDECFYIPAGDMCTSDFYGIVDGKPLQHPDGSPRDNQRYVSYIQEQPGYISPELAADTDRLIANMWFDWDSAMIQQTPQGKMVQPTSERLIGAGLTLVSANAPSAVPEPSALAILFPGLLTLGRIRRGRNGMRLLAMP